MFPTGFMSIIMRLALYTQ